MRNILLSACCVAMIFSLFLMGNCFADTPKQLDTQTLSQSLKNFLQTWDGNKMTNYVAAFFDLRAAKKLDAIVYLTGGKWCGSGGCTALVMEQENDSWKIVTKITITRPPIRVLQHTSYGWHNIGVWVQGGGVQEGYEAELPFNGRTYPENPTILPAQKLKEESAGEVVIESTDKPVPLFE